MRFHCMCCSLVVTEICSSIESHLYIKCTTTTPSTPFMKKKMYYWFVGFSVNLNNIDGSLATTKKLVTYYIFLDTSLTLTLKAICNSTIYTGIFVDSASKILLKSWNTFKYTPPYSSLVNISYFLYMIQDLKFI